MENKYIFILTFVLFSCTEIGTNKLNENIETIELTSIIWACDCAGWATKENIQKYNGNVGDTLAKLSIFIEPANKLIELPYTLGYSNDVIKFTGQFYKNTGFPKNYRSFQNPNKARVFRYTDYTVVTSNYKFSKIDTLQ